MVYCRGGLDDTSLSISVQQQMQPGGTERSEHEAGDCSEVAVDVQRREDEEQDEGEAGHAAVNQSYVSISRVCQSEAGIT